MLRSFRKGCILSQTITKNCSIFMFLLAGSNGAFYTHRAAVVSQLTVTRDNMQKHLCAVHRFMVPVTKSVSGSSSNVRDVTDSASEITSTSTSVPLNHAVRVSKYWTKFKCTIQANISYPKCALGSISQSFNAGWYRSRPCESSF